MEKMIHKSAFGCAEVMFTLCLGIYMIYYELRMWRFWYSAKCVTLTCKEGVWTRE